MPVASDATDANTSFWLLKLESTCHEDIYSQDKAHLIFPSARKFL